MSENKKTILKLEKAYFEYENKKQEYNALDKTCEKYKIDKKRKKKIIL
jgi:hypothetical protein